MKLLFDECIGYGIYRSLIPALDAYRPPVARAHMLDFTGRQGVPDEEWVPRAASEGWIVVTGDSGRSRLGAPLQELMPAHGVTGIYFSGKLHSPGQRKRRRTRFSPSSTDCPRSRAAPAAPCTGLRSAARDTPSGRGRREIAPSNGPVHIGTG